MQVERYKGHMHGIDGQARFETQTKRQFARTDNKIQHKSIKAKGEVLKRRKRRRTSYEERLIAKKKKKKKAHRLNFDRRREGL
jgi:hypothetical protein